MRRWMLAVGAILAGVTMSSADPPSDERVIANANVPPAGGGFLVTKCKVASGVTLPVPGLGFLPLPLDLWRCEVWQTPPRAPAGAAPVRVVVRLLTLAE